MILFVSISTIKARRTYRKPRLIYVPSSAAFNPVDFGHQSKVSCAAHAFKCYMCAYWLEVSFCVFDYTLFYKSNFCTLWVLYSFHKWVCNTLLEYSRGLYD